ncbi:MAG: hypothetical protein ACON4W_06685 [Parvibaculales bacterium]
MSLFSWAEKKFRRMSWLDIGIFKLCVFAFAMMLAGLLPHLPALGWKLWGAVFAVSYVWLLMVMLGKDDG